MMEHEQINDKTVALTTRCMKMTGRTLAKLMQAFLKKAMQPHIKHGEQSHKSLTKQGASLADIEISGNNIGTFKKTARKYNIELAKLSKFKNLALAAPVKVLEKVKDAFYGAFTRAKNKNRDESR